MYLQHFSLERSPFELIPDADFLYLSEQHAHAKACMNYVVHNHDSFSVITGDIGCGKTTLINSFLEDLDESILVARIFQTQVSPVQFLQTLLNQFGVEAFKKRKAELLEDLNQFLADCGKAEKQVVLVVDEAQNLSRRVLEELRLITDFEYQKRRVVNVILVGQPELEKKLNAEQLQQLKQRVRFHARLQPLTKKDGKAYIEHRIEQAGGLRTELFSESAIEKILKLSSGVPRLINLLSDTALSVACVNEKEQVDDDAVDDAAKELHWQLTPEEEENTQLMDVLPGNVHPLPTKGVPCKLMLTQNGHLIREFTITPGKMIIGRDKDNEISVDSDFISRFHSQILADAKGVVHVRDLKSTNGTFVNSKRVLDEKRRLHDGDVVRVGKHHLVFSGANPYMVETPDSMDLVVGENTWRGTVVLPASND